MEIVVVGCGEAFDEMLPNTSLLVRTGTSKILLDCGYSAVQEVWRNEPDVSALDVIYISHAHADHYFGLPALLGRMWEEGRTKRLTIVSQEQVIRSIEHVLEYGYRTLRQRYRFPLEFCPVDANSVFQHEGITFRFAPSAHSSPNLAVRLDTNGRSMCYSGDGDFTDASRELYREADILFHEAFGFERSDAHATVAGVLKMAAESAVRRVALLHVSRRLRRERTRLFEVMLEAEVRCVLPEPNDVLFV